MAELLTHPDLWEHVARSLDSPHQYDLSDSSEAMDVVQIVCETLANQGYVLTHAGDHALGWDSTMFVKDATGTIRKVTYE